MAIHGYKVIPCAFCETEFVFTEGDWRDRLKKSKTGRLYCSRECATRYQSVNRWTKRVVQKALAGEGPEKKD